MYLIYRWKCPHCGLEQNASAEVTSPHGYIARQLVLCDCDEGGCDRYVVTQPELTITATTYIVVEAQPPTKNDADTSEVDASWAHYQAIKAAHQDMIDGRSRRHDPPHSHLHWPLQTLWPCPLFGL